MAAVMAARVGARLAGPAPGRVGAGCLLESTSRVGGCASTEQCARARRGRCWGVAGRRQRREGMEGHHGTVQVEGFREWGEMVGLVGLGVDLEVVQEAPAVLGDAEEVDPGAVGAAGSAGGLAVYGHRP